MIQRFGFRGRCGGLVVCLLASGSFAGSPVRVASERVFLRDAPDRGGRAVVELDSGSSVEILDSADDVWTRVVPPGSVDFWVYADLVEDGKVAVSRAQIRSGDGLDYKVVGQVQRDQSLSIRGKSGDWLKIAPPPGSHLWVESRLLALPGASAGKAPPRADRDQAVSLREPSPREEVETTKPAPSSSGEARAVPSGGTPGESTLPSAGYSRGSVTSPEFASPVDLSGPRDGAGGMVRVRGIVRRSGFICNKPGEYRLVTRDRMGRAVTLCFLLGREDRLAGLLDRIVEVHGEKIYVPHLAYPAIHVRRLHENDV